MLVEKGLGQYSEKLSDIQQTIGANEYEKKRLKKDIQRNLVSAKLIARYFGLNSLTNSLTRKQCSIFGPVNSFSVLVCN